MAISRPVLTNERKPLRAADIVGLIAGSALLLGVLSVLVFVVPNLRPKQIEPSAEEIAEQARKEAVKAALMHRQGTILFVEPDTCHEQAFDNWTGGIGSAKQIDCDERLANQRSNDSEKAAERMRSVVDGFHR